MIPNLLHFCINFGRREPFGLRHYLAVATAVKVNRPDVAFIRYYHEPEGAWWERAKSLPSVQIERVTPPTMVFDRPLCHYAHQADVHRLQMLLEHGGAYLDIDTICLRSFAPLRVGNACVLGQQGAQGKPGAHGLCNAIMLAEKGSYFISSWHAAYCHFRSTGRDRYWDEHSVVMPKHMASLDEYKPHITVLGPRAFFFPLWDRMDLLMESGDASLFNDSYAIHLWEQITEQKWLSEISTGWLKYSTCNFALFTKGCLPS